MKNTLTRSRGRLMAFCLALSTSFLFAQNQSGRVAEWLENQPGAYQEMPLFHLSDAANDRSGSPEGATFLQIDPAIAKGLHRTAPGNVRLSVPTAGGDEVQLKLVLVDVLSPDFRVTLNDGTEEFFGYEKPVCYRGVVEGDESSMASLTVSGDDVQAMIVSGDQNLFLEKNGPGSDEYILVDKKDVPNLNAVECESIEAPAGSGGSVAGDRGVGCKIVNVFFECDYQMFLDKGSSAANVTAYVNSFFNQVATLYANENIEVKISAINIWDQADPYRTLTSTSSILNQFLATKGTNFTGNLAHFLSTRSVGGGIAYVDVLCNKNYAFGVSQVYNTFANVPTYSWTVEVVTHELGHNMGAWHTHSCNWPGGPIDNCYTVEGSCAAGPAPTNGGTIMSYCHLTSVGINFNNGFGTVAGNHLRSRVTNATCLSQSGTPPTTFSTTNITSSGGTFNWGAVTGAVNYSIQYKTAAATTWTSGGTTTQLSMPVSGLASSTNYQWQVKTDCSGWSGDQTFATSAPTSSSCAQPAGMATTAVGTTTATLAWNSVPGAVSYAVQYKTSAATTWTTPASVTGTNLNLTGLTASTSYVWMVKADCSVNSNQTTFTTAAAPVTTCSKPAGMTTTAILTTSATLVWNSVPGATNYTVKYKLKSASAYITLQPVTTTTYNLTGLTKGKQYVWQVKANCSSYTSNVTFTTAAQFVDSGDEGFVPTNRAMVLSPNPVGSSVEQLKIEFHQAIPEGAEMFVCDAAGRPVRQSGIVEKEMWLPVAELPYGIYTVMIVAEGQRLGVQRFVRIE